ncbi:MAG: 3-methylcrotonyl-CoA carboxylase, partial [Burkholderiales bacterium]|nr:3-methylcrotonyl-CoA carboxylase [Burkholderiales bacterium]
LIEKNHAALFPRPGRTPRLALVAAAVDELATLRATTQPAARVAADPHSPWLDTDAWWPLSTRHAAVFAYQDGEERGEVRLSGPFDALSAVIDGKRIAVRAVREGGRWCLDVGTQRIDATVVRLGEDRLVFAPGLRRRLTYLDPLAHAGEEAQHAGHLAAPMSGTVVAVHVSIGDRVARGAPLIVLEAMKMEHTIAAPAPGIVTAINFAVGDRVPEGADLVDLEDPPAA